MICSCEFHRYHVAHLCECGLLYAHSQAACDAHRTHACLDVDPRDINCQARDLRMHAQEVFDKMVVEDTAQSQPSFQAVYLAFAEMERPQPHSVRE